MNKTLNIIYLIVPGFTNLYDFNTYLDMKKMIIFLNCLLYIGLITITISSCSSSDSGDRDILFESGLQLFEMSWEGRNRTYQVYFPPEQFFEQKLPILFVLHGGGFTRNGFNKIADREGFIVVYPEGFEKQWNDGRGVQGIVTAWDENIDDVGFISEIARLLSNDFSIDTSRIFTSGISNGGFMSSRLLCDRADLFRGGAIITATISESYLPNCNPTSPVSVLVLNGTEDPIVPYEGGQVVVLGQQRGQIISTDDYIQFWATNNGCESNALVIDFPDTEDDGTMVQINTNPNCTAQTRLQLYRIEGGGHTWPGSLELLPENLVGRTSKEFVACDVIWDFFSGL